jgi:hypothetical protein
MPIHLDPMNNNNIMIITMKNHTITNIIHQKGKEKPDGFNKKYLTKVGYKKRTYDMTNNQ